MPKTHSFSKLFLCIGHKSIYFTEKQMTLQKQWMTLVYQIITTWCWIQIEIEIAVPLYSKSSRLTTFYVPKIKIRGWVNLYNFSYNENFGKFTKFCQDTFLNSFYTLAKWPRNLLIFLGPHSFMLPENLITVNGLPKL